MILLQVALGLLVLLVLINLVFGRLPRPPYDGGGVVETAHGPLHYVETVGLGPTIIFIHGMPSSCREFDLVRERFPDRHTIAFDRPGYAWSDGPPLAFAEQVDALVAAAQSLGVEHAVVVGHSFGGLAALGTAIRHPQFVERLLLVAPAAGGSRVAAADERLAHWLLRLERPVVRQLADLIFFRLLRRTAAKKGAQGIYGDATGLETQRRVAESMLARHNSLRALANDRLLFNDAERTVTKGLARVTQPALILHGKSDTTVPPRNAQRLVAALPEGRLDEIQGDHHLPTSDTEAVASALRRLEAR